MEKFYGLQCAPGFHPLSASEWSFAHSQQLADYVHLIRGVHYAAKLSRYTCSAQLTIYTVVVSIDSNQRSEPLLLGTLPIY